jgi:hypothetical protein
MKKINLIEMVQDFLTGGDAPTDMESQYHPEIIKKYLENAYNQVVYQVWMNGKKFSDYSQLDVWSKVYECTIIGNAPEGYALLPFAPVQLPNNMGIRQVCSHDDNTNVFAYIEATANVVFAELEVSTLDDTPTFRLEQNNVTTTGSHILRFEQLPINNPIDTIDVMMIVPLEEMGDYDDIAMPAGMEDILVKQTVEFLSKKPMQDTVNDGNANRPVQ